MDISGLRWFGLLLGFAGLVVVLFFYRGPRWRRSNFLILFLLNLALIAVSANPNLVNVLADMLTLKEAKQGRLIALLILSTIALWFILLYVKGTLDVYRTQFDRAVRAIGARAASPELLASLQRYPVVVLIPALNEAENLKALLPRMPKQVDDRSLGVLVIDDGSDDDTAAAARAGGALVVENLINRGGGAALRLGYDVLKRAGVQWCVTMDADGQHRPEEIEAVLRPVLAGQADLVIGSRVVGAREKDSPLRLAGVYFFSFLVSRMLGRKITDCSSGFRAFGLAVVESVHLKEDQYHTSELIIDAVKKGLKIAEAPITIQRRFSGKSKKGKDWKYGLNFAKTIVKTWFR